MKIFLASVDVYDELLKVSDNRELHLLFSFYDLFISPIPFRKTVWSRIIKEKE